MTGSDERRVLANKKIGVFGKGGAGKSTAVVLLARTLVRAGYTVSVLDADSTNVGLNRALGIEQGPLPLIRLFGGMVFSGGTVTCPVDDPTPLQGAEISLDAIPREYFAEVTPHLYLLTAGKLGESGAGGGCDGPISKIARDVRIGFHAEPVVTLVDFKAGFEDSARGVVTGLDWAVVIVDPTQASLALAVHMKEMVVGIRSGRLPATQHLEDPELVAFANRLYREARLQSALFVLSRVPDDDTEAFMRCELARHGIEPIGVIREDPSIGRAWLTGAPVDATAMSPELKRIVRELENAVSEAAATR